MNGSWQAGRLAVNVDAYKEPNFETDYKVDRYIRVCPKCDTDEGQGPVLNESEYGKVSCLACKKVLAYFNVWDCDIQEVIAKVWCCKHPRLLRQPIRHVIMPAKDVPWRTRWLAFDCLPNEPEPKAVKKYVCSLCLQTATKGMEYSERFDVEWSKKFLDQLTKVWGRDATGMLEVKMPWQKPFDEPLQIKDKPVVRAPGESKPEYCFDVDGYMGLPYVCTYHQDPSGQFGVRVIELNLIVHADSPKELNDKLQAEMRAWFTETMAKELPVPLPVGMEYNQGKLTPVKKTTYAIPAQYQRHVK